MAPLQIDLMLYRNDATSITRLGKLDDAIAISTSALKGLYEWFCLNKLKLIEGKTKFMVLSTETI